MKSKLMNLARKAVLATGLASALAIGACGEKEQENPVFDGYEYNFGDGNLVSFRSLRVNDQVDGEEDIMHVYLGDRDTEDCNKPIDKLYVDFIKRDKKIDYVSLMAPCHTITYVRTPEAALALHDRNARQGRDTVIWYINGREFPERQLWDVQIDPEIVDEGQADFDKYLGLIKNYNQQKSKN